MKYYISILFSEIRKFFYNDHIKNSFFLIVVSILSAGVGFLFWMIASRFYTPTDIGIASALISVTGFISILSIMGFDIVLIKKIPQNEHINDLINTTFSISALVALCWIIIYLIGIRFFTPSLYIITNNFFLLSFFILFTLISPLVELQLSAVFVGLKKAEYSFYETCVTIFRLGILPFLIVFGVIGIYFSYGITIILAFSLGYYLLLSKNAIQINFGINLDVIRNISAPSFGNYIARIFELMPNFLLPILIINMLGAEANAYFFIAWQLSMLIVAIPKWISMSLIAESSGSKQKFINRSQNSIRIILIYLILILIMILLFGDAILNIFGSQYSENSYAILVLLSLGCIPYSIIYFFAAHQRINQKYIPIIIAYLTVNLVILASSYLLIKNYGLIGIGCSWIIGNGLVAFIILLFKDERKNFTIGM